MKHTIGFIALLGSLLLLAGTVLAGDEPDLTKAVKIGTGKTMVIEFTDPDCPYCRKAADYFRTRKDVTLYIFFYPLEVHPASKGKIRYILSAPDRARAYEEVMTGRWDDSRLADITAAGIKLQEEHLEIARRNKIDSTPTFMIYGRIIEGFDLRRIEEKLR